MPWVVLSALGLFWGVGFVGRVGYWGRWRFGVLAVVLFFVFLLLLNFALRIIFKLTRFSGCFYLYCCVVQSILARLFSQSF